MKDRALLHDAIRSLDDTLPHTQYIKEWASSIADPPINLIPDSLRADLENKYEFPSFGNHLQKEAVTAASAARWEALVVCIRV